MNSNHQNDGGLVEALEDVTAHLTAACSLLSRSPKKGAPSNKMFDQMLTDYQASADRGRATLKAALSSQQGEAVPVGQQDAMRLASDLLLSITGQEGGLPRINWYLLRNRMADAFAKLLAASPVPADAGEPGIKAAYERGRADAYVEAAALHEEDAQAYNHARDPGMANHQRSYARKFRKRAEIIRSALVPTTSQAKGSE